VEEAFQGEEPGEVHVVGPEAIRAARDRLTTIDAGGEVDFVTLGCPHYTLEQMRWVAGWLREREARVHPGVRLWLCTNRQAKQAAVWEGIAAAVEAAGGRIVCDTCPVESHMRISTCKDLGLPTPQIRAMATDSCKMARYVGDLVGCRTALLDKETCLRAAVAGKLV
jgi:predicted aconitase